MHTSKGATASWQDSLYDLLRRSSVTQFAYVPDAGHRVLIDRSLADPQARPVALTTEEKGWRCWPAPISAARAASSCKLNMDPPACRNRFRAALLTNS